MKTSDKELLTHRLNLRPSNRPADAEAEAACRHEEVPVLEEIVIEELAVDGICGIY